MRSAVVAHGLRAHCRVDLCVYAVAHFKRALHNGAVVAKHICSYFLCVVNGKTHIAGNQHTFVADLATAFGVERRCIQHHNAVLTLF